MNRMLEIIALLMIACFAQVASDLYTPSLPAIGAYFGVGIEGSQMTIAVYMLALTLTQLFWGGLSDAIGRKNALKLGLSIGVVGAMLCSGANSMGWLLVGRFVQGLGNGAAAGLWRAIFRDRYTGEELASVASYFGNLLVLVLISAPLLGGFFQEYFSWRVSFYFLLGWALVCILLLQLFIRETGSKPETTPWFDSYRRLLGSPVFMGCCFCNFLTYGAMFAWITIGSSILVEQMGMTPLWFGFGSAITGMAMLVGSTINGRFVKIRGIPKMLTIGWAVITGSGTVLLLASWGGVISPYMVLICVFGFYTGSALIFSNTFATAFAPFGDIAGLASGLYAFIQMAGGAVTSYMLASLQGGDAGTLGLLFVGTGGMSWLSYRLLVVNAKV